MICDKLKSRYHYTSRLQTGFYVRMGGKGETMMNNIKASDLWRQGQALCNQGRFVQGLAFMEKAAKLDSTYRKPLTSFCFELYNDLCSGAVSKGDLDNAGMWQLYQKYKSLRPLYDKKHVTNVKKAANWRTRPQLAKPALSDPRNLPEEAPVKSCYTGPYESWYRSKSPFKLNSIFAPIHPLQLQPQTEPALETLKPLPAGLFKKALSLFRALFWPLVIMLVIQIIIYGSIVFFDYLGDYMGWH